MATRPDKMQYFHRYEGKRIMFDDMNDLLPQDTPDDLSAAERSRKKRKIPVGLHISLDPFSSMGTPPMIIGIFILALTFKMAAVVPISFELPWYWNDAGMAEVTEVETIHHFDGQSAERVSYVYRDSHGLERRSSDVTAKKAGFFVVGHQYPLLKYQDEWRYTVLADLSLWERHPLLASGLQLYGLVAILLLYALLARALGRKVSHWKCELLRYGNYAQGTFLQRETAPIYWRILGFKYQTFLFVTETGEQCVAMFIRKRSKKEPPEVDVFYDPDNPHRSFVLQSLGGRKFCWYAPDSDTIVCARGLTAVSWMLKIGHYALWGFMIWMLIRIFL